MLSEKDFMDKRLKMVDFYLETEQQFLELIRTIPLDNDPKTYSPKLYNILQSSCGQVENIMRLICERFDLKPENSDFPSYSGVLNKNNILQLQQVYQKKTYKRYFPFQMPNGEKSPFWWKGYNQTKHKLPDGLQAGNLENTIYALSATYLLNCMAFAAQSANEKFFDWEWWRQEEVIIGKDGNVTVSMFAKTRPLSEIFYPITIFKMSIIEI